MIPKRKSKSTREDKCNIYHLCIINTLSNYPNSTSEFIFTQWDMSCITFYRYVNELVDRGIVFKGRVYVGNNQREYRYSLSDEYISNKEYKHYDDVLEIGNMNTKIILGGKISIEYSKEKNTVLVNGEDFNKQSYIKGCRDGYKDATSKINKKGIKNKVSFYVDDEEQVLKIKDEGIIQLVKDYIK